MSGRQTTQQELVFCHACEDEWYKNDHGLKCPACGSEIVEIIDQNTDPRPHDHDDHDDPTIHDHPLHDHNPWAGDAPDPDDGDISHVEWTGPGGARFSRTTMRSGGGGLPPGMRDPFGPMFGTLMGGLAPANRQPDRGSDAGGTRTSNASITFGVGGGRSPQMRIIRAGGTENLAMDDLHGIMNNLLNVLGPPPGAHPRGNEGPGGEPGPPFNPMMRMLMNLVPPLATASGDAAYTDEAFDRIISALREQNEHSDAPGPATAAAINALPKIKITKEQQDEDGSADCSICMETVEIGTEVSKLPCGHWFHGECITSWLKEHDTCPQCRRGITPKEGDQNTPRDTGQTPRYWQPNEEDINRLARQATQESRSSEGPSRTATGNSQSSRNQPESPTASSSSRQNRRESDHGRRGGLAGMISGMGRRLGGHHDGGSRSRRE